MRRQSLCVSGPSGWLFGGHEIVTSEQPVIQELCGAGRLRQTMFAKAAKGGNRRAEDVELGLFPG